MRALLLALLLSGCVMPVSEWTDDGAGDATSDASTEPYANAPSLVDLRVATGAWQARNEEELRNALTALRRTGRPGTVFIAEDIVLRASIEIDSDFPPVTFQGAGRTTIYYTGSAYAFGIAADYVTFRGLRVRGEDDDTRAPVFIQHRHTDLITGLVVAECTIVAEEFFDYDGANGWRRGTVRDNLITGAGSSLWVLNLEYCERCHVQGNEMFGAAVNYNALRLYSTRRTAITGNGFAYGDVEIDSDGSTETQDNAFTGNVLIGNLAEANNGGTFNAYVGNAFGTGLASIDTSAGSGNNTIIGNTGVGGSITAHANDTWQTATDSDPLNE